MLKSDVNLIVSDISKKFNIGFLKKDSALSRFLNFILSRETKRLLTVLDSVSFKVKRKENIGIIGDNGSGKSTLLRIIAGIYQADSGIIKKRGKVVYINGFGLGLKPRLSMRNNIYLLASVMGLSRREIKERFQDIVNFSGLKEYVDTKVYQFSSGMISRLCFSITIFCLKEKRPEILLLDEVFGTGGDIDFQKKALAKIEDFLQGGSAILMVSHQLGIIKKYCHKVILLESGRIKKIGQTDEVIAFYLEQKNKEK